MFDAHLLVGCLQRVCFLTALLTHLWRIRRLIMCFNQSSKETTFLTVEDRKLSGSCLEASAKPYPYRKAELLLMP